MCSLGKPPLPRSWFQSRTASVCASLTQRAPRSPWYQSHSPGVQPRQPPCLGLGFSHALQCVCFLDTASSAHALVSVTLAWCAASATPLASVLVSVTHCGVCASLTQRAPRTPWYQSHSPGVQPRQPPLPRSWFQSRTAVCVLP